MIIPSHKFDIELVKKLNSAKDEDILENLPLLLEWLQDSNWPVFEGVCKRISSLNEKLEKDVLVILNGNDVIWKSIIIEHLFPKLSMHAQMRYNEILYQLLESAKPQDIEEGLVDSIKVQLSKFENGVQILKNRT